MENDGEERVHVGNCLKQLEDVAAMLNTAVKEKSLHMVSVDMPNTVINLLHKLSSLSSRSNGERLLAAGR